MTFRRFEVSTFVVLAAACLPCALRATSSRSGVRAAPGDLYRDPESIAAIAAGTIKTAQAEWWGLNATDATEAVQQAIDSKADVIVISYVGRPWIVRPLKLRSGLTLRLEPGVVLEAKRGAFEGKHDSMLLAEEVRDVTITGYGATLRMYKSDYRTGKYERSEWRHGICLKGARNVKVAGLRIEQTGGDGIYVGSTWDKRRVPSEDIRIRDCTCAENLRQGISVVSGKNVRIENCLLQRSGGAAPQAGLDIEPSHPDDAAVDVEVVRCRAIDNAGSGFMVNLSRLTDRSLPVSVRFTDCLTRGSVQPGLRALLDEDRGARGLVEFTDCTVESTEYAGLALRWDVATQVKLAFTRCRWSDVGKRRGEPSIHFDLRLPERGGKAASPGAGVHFLESRVFNHVSREVIGLTATEAGLSGLNVRGELEVYGVRPVPPAGVAAQLSGLSIIYKGDGS